MTLEDDIAAAATTPKSFQNGDQKAESRPLTELIAADKYLKGLAAEASAVTTGRPRITFSKLVPPGAS